jgi:valyl-tRNA synthetase
MAVRPQGHYIIASWLFPSLLHAQFIHHRAPWDSVLLSGRLAAADRELDPMTLIDGCGADAVRYWAASWQPGRDVTVDASRLRRGRRLAAALIDLHRRCRAEPGGPSPRAGRDPASDAELFAATGHAIAASTAALDQGRYDRALAEAAALLGFMRRNVAPAHNRADGTPSRRSMVIALDVLLRLFAPFQPFATEECWSATHSGSVHRSSWPTVDELGESRYPS